MVRTLPDGGFVIAQDAGGVFRTITHKPVPADPPDPYEGLALDYIPMLFSGVVKKAVVMGNEGVSMEVTQQTIKRLAGYKPNNQQRGTQFTLQRFVIGYHNMVSEFMQKPGAAFHTQYVQQRPTWYSGSMATVMQIVGGYGRCKDPDLPDTPVERAEIKLPEKVMKKIRNDISNLRLPGYTGVPPKSGQFQYDYKFHNTHGVVFGSDRTPWLVLVSQKGLYIMPLPMVVATTSEHFREYMDEVGDDEIKWILERLGGMPSGESFPLNSEEFERWRRAGVIIKLGDTSGFYENYMFSSTSGWSFSLTSNEAVNTCYNYDEDGIQLAFTYQINFTIGEIEGGGRLPKSFHLKDDYDGRLLDQYLAGIYSYLKNKPEGAATKYKIRRVPVGDLLSRAKSWNGNAEQEFEHWDALELDPIAAAGASVAVISSGNIWAGGAPRTHPQIKFPEPLFYGCISHDFTPLNPSVVPSNHRVLCDTIMFAYYIENDLKVCKYFLDQFVYTYKGESNYDECMQVGSWEQTVHTGQLSIHGRFYTTDFDGRESYAPITEVTKIVGRDAGYDHTPFFSFDHYFAMPGSIWRNRYYTHDVESEKTEGKSKTIALCVPYFSRNSVFHADRVSTTGVEKRKSRGLYATRDPNSYRYYTYDSVWAWVGGPSGGNAGTATDVDPQPSNGDPVWVTGYNYDPSPCSDFADQGDWIGGLPTDVTWLVHPDQHVWQHDGGGGAPTVKTFSETTYEPGSTVGELWVSLTDKKEKVNDNPREGFFTISPNQFGDVFYTDATRVTAGDSVYSSVAEADPNAERQRKRWGYTRLADHKTAHHFIGVIHE